MTDTRVLIINADGTAVVGGVEYVLVPREPTEEMARDGAAKLRDFFEQSGPYPRTKAMYKAMLSAAAIDLSGLPRVPERVLLESDPFCPKCGHNRDISSVSSVGVKGGKHECQLCAATWTEQALDDIEVALKGKM